MLIVYVECLSNPRSVTFFMTLLKNNYSQHFFELCFTSLAGIELAYQVFWSNTRIIYPASFTQIYSPSKIQALDKTRGDPGAIINDTYHLMI